MNSMRRSYREDDTLAEINAALRKQGLPALDRLPQLFAGDDYLVHTLPLLDPYARYRRTPAMVRCSIARRAPARRTHERSSSTFRDGVEVRNDVVCRAAADRRMPFASTRLRLRKMRRTDLARRGAIIEPQRVDVASLLPQCRLVVHLGGIGLAAEALLAGVPQFTLVTHVEQHLTGHCARARRNRPAVYGLRRRADASGARSRRHARSRDHGAARRRSRRALPRNICGRCSVREVRARLRAPAAVAGPRDRGWPSVSTTVEEDLPPPP